MTLTDLVLCCPACAAELQEDGIGEHVLRCSSCDRTYPIIAGIPDLRTFSDPYIGIAADRAKGLRVAERAQDTDFAGLLEYYYSITDVVPPEQARRYIRGLLAAPARATVALDAWEAAAGAVSDPATASFLEIGCGTAPLLIAAAPRYRSVVGVDIAFRWLAVAQKRLDEAGIELPLICACAESLPFAGQQFQRVAADSTLETVRSQRRALREVHRVLVPGGALFVATPNALSVGPDPHIGMWASGYFPRAWVARRARREGSIPPKRRLLSIFTLQARIRESGLLPAKVFLPSVPAAQRRHFPAPFRAAIGLYSVFTRIPGLRRLLYLVGPLLYAVARKPSA
jgi:SAM-dependent methyltransferase